MSYEGTEQYICTNGHQYFAPCLQPFEEHPSCPICQSPPIWYHAIDETNGIVTDENGEVEPYCIPVDLEILSPEVTEISQCCEQERTVHHPTYRIPLGIGVSLQTL